MRDVREVLQPSENSFFNGSPGHGKRILLQESLAQGAYFSSFYLARALFGLWTLVKVMSF